MPTKALKCGKCGRTFLMAAHLARHLSAGHGGKKKTTKKAAKTAGKRRMGRKKAATTGRRGRPPGSKNAPKKLGRPSGLAARLGLRTMPIEDLITVVDEARAIVRDRLADYQRVF